MSTGRMLWGNLDRLRARRREVGRAKYRREGEPFVGDPIDHFVEEIADALNYNEEMGQQRLVSEECALDVDELLHRTITRLRAERAPDS